MKIINKKTSELMPYINNQKIHPPHQIEKIANSIYQFGFVQPIVIDKDNTIVIGHGRFEAAIFLKYKEVPCLTVENLSEAQIKALRLADNKLNESTWDDDLVQLELLELDKLVFDYSELLDFNFDIEDLDIDNNLFEDDNRYLFV